MAQETQVAVIEDRQVAIQELETRFAMAVRQRELLENYIKERLHPGKHFYKIERTGDEVRGGGQQKPSLTKEGAELICLPHSLKAHYDWLSGLENPPLDDSPYQITMKCILERNGGFEGEGVGSASSHITKKDGSRIFRQRDPGLRHNATVKMACKSAYIAATLNATAASEFFTQDLEDDKTGGETHAEPKGHYCTLHKTVFFKRGKMKGYAHPIGDTGEWCNEEGEVVEQTPEAKTQPQQRTKSTEKPLAEESNGKLPDKGEYPTDPSLITSIEKLAVALKRDFDLTYQEQWDELNLKSWNELTLKPSEAYIAVASSRIK